MRDVGVFCVWLGEGLTCKVCCIDEVVRERDGQVGKVSHGVNAATGIETDHPLLLEAVVQPGPFRVRKTFKEIRSKKIWQRIGAFAV